MRIIESFITKNDGYKANVNKQDSRYTTFQTRGALGLMIHSIGTPQPDAKVIVNNWNMPGKEVNAHAVFGTDGKVYQMLPWNYRGWHAGNGEGNNRYIGVEMTEPNTIKYTSGANWVETGDGKNTKKHVLATYKIAVELFAHLCGLHGLDPLAKGVIVSHSEAYKMGLASNHGDVEHLWSKFGLSMDQFRIDVAAKLKEAEEEMEEKIKNQVIAELEAEEAKLWEGDNPSEWAKDATDWAKEAGLFTGDGNGNYGWQSTITREQVAQLLYNLAKNK